jgi:hypothetical protein
VAVEDVISTFDRHQEDWNASRTESSLEQLAVHISDNLISGAVDEEEGRSLRRYVADRAGGGLRIAALPAD